MTEPLAAIPDELAAILRSVIQAENQEIQVSARLNLAPDSFAIDVYPADPFITQEEAGFDETEGATNWIVRARIVGDHDAEQDFLLRLMDVDDDLSVATTLDEDQTLNGLATSVEVIGPSGFRVYLDTANDAGRWGVEWNVTVLRAHS